MAQTDTKTNASNNNQNLTGLSTTSPATVLHFRKPLIIFAHIAAFAVSLLLAFLVLNDMRLERYWLVEYYARFIGFFIIVKLVIFGLFKQYRGWWRYVSISDLLGILRASFVSTLIIVAFWFLAVPGIDIIRRNLPDIAHVDGVLIADMVATFMLLGGLRMVIRLYYEEFRTIEAGRLKRFLIVGAGNAGEALLREIHRMPIAQYEVVGFIDDDPVKKGITIHGLSVLGTVEQLPKVCEERNIE